MSGKPAVIVTARKPPCPSAATHGSRPDRCKARAPGVAVLRYLRSSWSAEPPSCHRVAGSNRPKQANIISMGGLQADMVIQETAVLYLPPMARFPILLLGAWQFAGSVRASACQIALVTSCLAFWSGHMC